MQGLQTARILAARGIPVIGTTEQAKHHATRSNSCRQVLVAETNDDLLAQLERLGSTLPHKAVLFPCKDGIVRTVSKSRERLSNAYEIVLPPHNIVEMLMDKDSFTAYAEDNGYSVPFTRRISSRGEFEGILPDVRYPCVIKPAYRSEAWSAHSVEKAFMADDESELRSLYDRCSEWVERLVIQQWVPGDESDLVSCNVYFTRQSVPVASFVARKLRQWPLDTGQSSLGEEWRNDAVLALTLDLFERVGYMGLGYLEVKVDPTDGEPYIIEPNVGRPTGRSAIAEAGGVELLYTMYCDALGLTLPAARQQTYQGVKWIHVRRDLQAALVRWRRGELTIGQWWASVRGRKAFAVFSLRDPAPFFFDIWDTLRVVIGGRRGT
jgi:predicted ATP-grasp superfamily ATP-dependent carboligase